MRYFPLAPQSPDLSIVEPFRSTLEKKVLGLYPLPSSLSEPSFSKKNDTIFSWQASGTVFIHFETTASCFEFCIADNYNFKLLQKVSLFCLYSNYTFNFMYVSELFYFTYFVQLDANVLQHSIESLS